MVCSVEGKIISTDCTHVFEVRQTTAGIKLIKLIVTSLHAKGCRWSALLNGRLTVPDRTEVHWQAVQTVFMVCIEWECWSCRPFAYFQIEHPEKHARSLTSELWSFNPRPWWIKTVNARSAVERYIFLFLQSAPVVFLMIAVVISGMAMIECAFWDRAQSVQCSYTEGEVGDDWMTERAECSCIQSGVVPAPLCISIKGWKQLPMS